jgi:hypothetical protein
MPLVQLVYCSAVIAGWAAFLGWLVSEYLFFGAGAEPGIFQDMLIGGIIGAAIGLGLNVIAGMANAQWKQLLLRALPGLLGGCLGGAAGSLIGDILGRVEVPRGFGWMIVGLGIGCVEGLYERSPSKLRNGLIGGGIGGLLGGFLFDPISALVATESGMTARATAFVILGMCIGALIGLAQVVFREAWLTVLDGYRVGRQLILSQPVTILGRAEHLPLPFLGPRNKDLEPQHVKIIRRPGGSYAAEDNHSRLGTRLNNQPLQGQAPLRNGDVLKLGTNFVRFNERRKRSGAEPLAAAQPAAKPVAAPPPPKARPAAPAAKPQAPAKPQAAAPEEGFYLVPDGAPSKPAVPPKTPAAPTAPPGPSTAAGGRPPGGIAPPPPPRRPKSS